MHTQIYFLLSERIFRRQETSSRWRPLPGRFSGKLQNFLIFTAQKPYIPSQHLAQVYAFPECGFKFQVDEDLEAWEEIVRKYAAFHGIRTTDEDVEEFVQGIKIK
eukprot:605847-Amorphochlora_amoeboformis.AAC.1